MLAWLPTEQKLAAEKQRRADIRARASFREFVFATYPGLKPGWHIDVLCAALQQFAEDVQARKSPRLIVTMPPRHTKSSIASQRFPVWGMGNFGWDVILGSYAQSLADEHSIAARDIARSSTVRRLWPHTVRLPSTATSDEDAPKGTNLVRRWTLGRANGGDPSKYVAIGVDGAGTGKGCDVFIFDDPHKDRAEAESAPAREALWRFYTSVAYTRLSPGGGILDVQTRWHEDDLAGRLISRMEEGGEVWTVINLPALAEVDEYYEDGSLRRAKGEALHPERYPVEHLLKVQALNEYDFASLYQQRPMPAEGGMIKGAWLAHEYEQLRDPIIPRRSRLSLASPLARVPGGGTRIISIDTANKPGAKSAYTTMGSFADQGAQSYLADVYREKIEFADLIEAVVLRAERDDPDAVLIEDMASGVQLMSMLKRDKRWRWSVIPIKVGKEGKQERLRLETPYLHAGRLLLPRNAPHVPAFRGELLMVPGGTYWDQADMLSQYLAYLRKGYNTLAALYDQT